MPFDQTVFVSWEAKVELDEGRGATRFTQALCLLSDLLYVGSRYEAFGYSEVFPRPVSPIQALWFRTHVSLTKPGKEQGLKNEFEARFGTVWATPYRVPEALSLETIKSIDARYRPFWERESGQTGR